MKWLVQTNFGKDSRINEFVDALKEAKFDYSTFEYIPYSNELPSIDKKDVASTFLYGSTSVIELASKTELWKDSLFFNEANFCYKAWAKNYGSLLLNDPKDTSLIELKDFEVWSQGHPLDEMVFIRPNKDLKEFNGQVVSVGEFLLWSRDVTKGGYATVSGSTEIAVSLPHGIVAEYRTFMTDSGEVVACSQYKRQGKMYLDRNVPKEVLSKACEIAKIWSPSKLFTLDLALSGDSLWIVEAQGIHSAGFYNADLDLYIHSVENFYKTEKVTKRSKRCP